MQGFTSLRPWVISLDIRSVSVFVNFGLGRYFILGQFILVLGGCVSDDA